MSVDSLAIRVIDAITDDIDTSASLPRHGTVRYRRPVFVRPEDCPLLCVWLLQKGFTPRTTNNFDNAMNVGISWQVAATDRAGALIDNPERAKSSLRELEAIEARIRWLSVHLFDPPIDEAYEMFPVVVDYTAATAMETGLVEAYSMTVQVSVVETGRLS